MGLVIAVGATGVGLLRTEAELEGGGLRAVQIAGVVLAIAGIVGLFLFRRRTTDRTADPTLTALAVAAVIMGVLALIALPTSPDVTREDATTGTEGGGEGNPSGGLPGGSPSSGAPSGDLPGSDVDVPGSGSVSPNFHLEPPLAYTVAVDPATGRVMPVVLEKYGTNAVALDPVTGELIPFSFGPGDPAAGDSGLMVPGVTDPSTGEVNVVGFDEPGDDELTVVNDQAELDASDDDLFIDITGASGSSDSGGVGGGAGDDDVSTEPSERTDVDISELDFDALLERIETTYGGEILFDPDATFEFDLDDLEDAGIEIEEGSGDSDRSNESDSSTDGDDGGGLDFGAFFKGLLYVLLAGAAVLAIVLLLRAQGQFEWPWKRKKAGETPPDAPPVDAADAEAGLEASLAIAQDSGDPRQLITAAYHRLLLALAEAGGGRLPQEAPHEHLNRVLGPLGVRPEPVHQLAELYVMAQFSERPVTDSHRAAAATALEETLTDLRAALPPPPPPADGTPVGPAPALSGSGSPGIGGESR